MFVKAPCGKSYHAPPGTINTPDQVLQFLLDRKAILSLGSWRLEQNGRQVDEELLSTTSSVTVLQSGGLPGGKGGFGSLLRAIGAQIEKTTNHEAMRDLSGRRQREINNEQRVRDYMSKQSERDQLEVEKKEAKMEKLRRLAAGENKDRHAFSDPLYDKARSEVEEKVHDAVEAAFKLGNASTSQDEEESKGEKEKSGTAGKRKMEGDCSAVKKKAAKGLWMGDGLDDLNESDLSDSSDEEETETKSEIKSVVPV